MKKCSSFKKRYILAIVIPLFFFFFGVVSVHAECKFNPSADKCIVYASNLNCGQGNSDFSNNYCNWDASKNTCVIISDPSAICNNEGAASCKSIPICSWTEDSGSAGTENNSADPSESDKNAPKIVNLINPMTGNSSMQSIQTIIGNVILKLMGVLGALALLVFVYGGFKWLTAAGNEEHVKEGTQAMLWAVIGIFIIFGSYAIIRLIYTGLGIESDTVMTKVPTSIQTKEGCFCITAKSGAGVELKMPDSENYSAPGSCVSAVGTTDPDDGKLSECTWYEGGEVFASSNKSKLK